jgi:hypothetical protein
MTDKQEFNEVERTSDPMNESSEERVLESRRAFLLGLGKWSRAVIFGAVAGGALLTDRRAQAGWINRRGGGGGGWINGNGGGGSWVNRRGGGWGGSWINRR